jgi:hypothetical protein
VVPIAVLLTAAVILGGVVVVAMGMGGELARDVEDQPGYTDFQSSAEVASYRPPPVLLGYHPGSTERAFKLVARTIADRDAEIAWLRGRLAELQQEAGLRPEDTAAGREDQHDGAVPDGAVPDGTVPEGAGLDAAARDEHVLHTATRSQALPGDDR